MMSYAEFKKWCNQRAADGCWGTRAAITCIEIISHMQTTPFFKRKKRWAEINLNNQVYKDIVAPINARIEELNK